MSPGGGSRSPEGYSQPWEGHLPVDLFQSQASVVSEWGSMSPGGPYEPRASPVRARQDPSPAFQQWASPVRTGPIQPPDMLPLVSSLRDMLPGGGYQPRASPVRASQSSPSSSRSGRTRIPYRELPFDYNPPVYCLCGQKAGRFISFGIRYPGRRYYSCKHRQDEPGHCGFFPWHDPVLPQYITVLIEDLQHKVDELNQELAACKKNETGMQCILDMVKNLDLN